jgi:hypothetical protein
LILKGTPLARTSCSSLPFGLCANVGADAPAKSSSDSKSMPIELNGFRITAPLS